MVHECCINSIVGLDLTNDFTEYLFIIWNMRFFQKMYMDVLQCFISCIVASYTKKYIWLFFFSILAGCRTERETYRQRIKLLCNGSEIAEVHIIDQC